jgi:hypothetical protein
LEHGFLQQLDALVEFVDGLFLRNYSGPLTFGGGFFHEFVRR